MTPEKFRAAMLVSGSMAGAMATVGFFVGQPILMLLGIVLSWWSFWRYEVHR